MRRSLLSLLALAMPLAMLAAPSATAQEEDIRAADASGPILVELFTSQSCSSCPKAEALFSELALRDDLVTIQWHVDYWNNLVHGRDGRWVDPYSSADATQRQRDYNYTLRGTGSVYTPQAVIAGMTETTGSRKGSVNAMIERAPRPYAKIDVSSDATGMTVSVSAGGAPQDMAGEVMLVDLISVASNEILGGENRGRTATSRNIAVSDDTLGAWTGSPETYRARKVEAGHSCAVIVQEKSTGRILAASYCPDADPLAPDFTRAHP
ncbi:MAG: DUF1223 domain-containing protein [Hyphomonadaceae bacterium]